MYTLESNTRREYEYVTLLNKCVDERLWICTHAVMMSESRLHSLSMPRSKMTPTSVIRCVTDVYDRLLRAIHLAAGGNSTPYTTHNTYGQAHAVAANNTQTYYAHAPTSVSKQSDNVKLGATTIRARSSRSMPFFLRQRSCSIVHEPIFSILKTNAATHQTRNGIR